MQNDKIKGHRMTDAQSMTCEMDESDRALQRVIDALNEIGCTSFMLTKEEINSLSENDKKMGEAFYKMVVEPLRKWLNDEKKILKVISSKIRWNLGV